jgi:DNA-binding NarL/FixJ family response regulator
MDSCICSEGIRFLEAAQSPPGAQSRDEVSAALARAAVDRAGASGFLLKGGQPSELLSAIRLVAAGESLLDPSITKRLIEAYIAQPEQAETVTPEGLDELSPRELEVLGLVARGSTNREIAEALVLSPLTVKTHVSRILTKLRARDRVQLVVIAYQAGLVSP